MFGLIVRLLLILVALRLIVQFVGGLLRGLQGPLPPVRRAGRTSTEIATDLVRDPICNTFVPRTAALAGRLDGRDVYFCSAACRDKALARGH